MQDRIEAKLGKTVTMLKEACDHDMHCSVYADVAAERLRAHQKHSAKGHSSEQLDGLHQDWPYILLEELAEALTELIRRFNYDGDSNVDNLRSELIQVAAMATAWAEALDA